MLGAEEASVYNVPSGIMRMTRNVFSRRMGDLRATASQETT
jgi:hypothetical protein